MTDSDFYELGKSDDLAIYPVVPYYLEDKKIRISVTKIDEQLYAFDDLCPIHNCPLSAGLLDGKIVMCQVGGCLYDMTNGAVAGGPAKDPIGSYAARLTDDGKVEAQL